MGDTASGLLPDLRAGAAVVGFRVVAVGELIEHLAAPLGLHLQRRSRAPSMPCSFVTRISSAP